MPPETTPVPNPNQETMTKERSLVNKFKDKKLYDSEDAEVVMNKTARTALFILMKEKPDVATDVVFKNKKEDYSLNISSNNDIELWIPDKKPDRTSEENKLNIKILVQRMDLKPEDITEDMLCTFAIMRYVKHYFTYRGKTGYGFDEEIEKEKKSIQEEDKKLQGKPERDSSLAKFKRTLPNQVEADDFAVKWIYDHMYLFNPEVNPYLGQWSVEPEQQHPNQAGVVYQNPS